jgi:Ca2+-binding EF-hand superfamily protein
MSGFIDYTGKRFFIAEFVAASIQKNKIITRRHLEYTFDIIDKDKNGRLSLKELSVFLGGAISQQIYNNILK